MSRRETKDNIREEINVSKTGSIKTQPPENRFNYGQSCMQREIEKK